MEDERRYQNLTIQMKALGLQDDFDDFMGDTGVSFSDNCMAGMPEQVKMVDMPQRTSGFNRTVPGRHVKVKEYYGRSNKNK